MNKPQRSQVIPKTWRIRVFVFVLIAAMAFTLEVRQASAHAFLLRTDPADGSVLATAPKQMRLWFSEPIDLDLTIISLTDGNNKTWQLRLHPDVSDPSAVIVNLPDLGQSAYRLTWRTVSYSDLHTVSGAVVFGIGEAVRRAGSAQTQTDTPFAEVAFHWIGLLAFATVIGAVAVLIFLLPSVRRNIGAEQNLLSLSSLQNKILSLMLWCSLIAILAGFFTLRSKFVQASAGSIQGLNWKAISSLASLVYIERELMSEVCLIAITLLSLSWLKKQDAAIKAGIRNILLFSAVFLWIFLQALNSHASAFNDFSPARLIAYALHLFGAGLWIGGQIALIFFIAPRLQTKNSDYALAREIYRRFGGIAAAGVGILIVTGLYSGGQQVASLDALLLTDYGKALILKTLIVILAGLIGLSHAAHFHPRLASLLDKLIPRRIASLLFGKAHPASTLRIELLGGAAIFLLASFMSSTQPARGPEFEPPVKASAVSAPQDAFSGMADDLLVNFSIKPNQPGQNFISVGAFNTRRPAPGIVDAVTLKLLPPDGRTGIEITIPAAQSDGAGNFQVPTDAIQFSGDWKISVSVHRDGLDDTVVQLPWQVLPSAPVVSSRPVLISAQPLAPVMTVISILLTLLFASGWLIATLQPNLLHRSDDKVKPASQEMNL